MWFQGKLIPISEVPDKHPNGDPVMKPKLTHDERWFASMYPGEEIKKRDPVLFKKLYGDGND